MRKSVSSERCGCVERRDSLYEKGNHGELIFLLCKLPKAGRQSLLFAFAHCALGIKTLFLGERIYSVQFALFATCVSSLIHTVTRTTLLSYCALFSFLRQSSSLCIFPVHIPDCCWETCSLYWSFRMC